MIVEETFYRPPELDRVPRRVAARTYNLATLLLKRSGTDALFVPIRTMQYLAVVDAEEIIFVEREARPLIELSWQNFQVRARSSLDEAVDCELVQYHAKATQTMTWLPSAFHRALEELSDRQKEGAAVAGANVVKLNLPRN